VREGQIGSGGTDGRVWSLFLHTYMTVYKAYEGYVFMMTLTARIQFDGKPNLFGSQPYLNNTFSITNSPHASPPTGKIDASHRKDNR